jgi:hypothetical protein
MIFSAKMDYFLNGVNQFIFAMVKSCVFFAVRTEHKYLEKLRLQRVKFINFLRSPVSLHRLHLPEKKR